VAIPDPETLFPVLRLGGLRLGEGVAAEPVELRPVKALDVLDGRLVAAGDGGAPLPYQLGDRPIGLLFRVRAEQVLNQLPDVRLGALYTALLPLVPLGHLIQGETRAADQRPQVGRAAVDELGTELDGVSQCRRVNRVDPPAYSVATYMAHDRPDCRSMTHRTLEPHLTLYLA